MSDNDDLIELRETLEIEHRRYLSEFNEKVWPIYHAYGFKHDTALIAWTLNKINTNLHEIMDFLEAESS